MIDYQGKAYLVTVRSHTSGEQYLLLDISPADFMGLACIRGLYKTPSAKSHFMTGRMMYIPLDSVQAITEYDSFDVYRDAVKQHYEDKAN